MASQLVSTIAEGIAAVAVAVRLKLRPTNVREAGAAIGDKRCCGDEHRTVAVAVTTTLNNTFVPVAVWTPSSGEAPPEQPPKLR